MIFLNFNGSIGGIIPTFLKKIWAIEFVESSLKLNYCKLGDEIALLKEQYIVGTVEVRIMRVTSSNK
ncbi:hypothetical protein C7B62_24565 [Pleurocapsa sp. CCALA 161]|nr:hypothetical protein C7B62_24565 [Pleurocapsa sp. CCALA 161]